MGTDGYGWVRSTGRDVRAAVRREPRRNCGVSDRSDQSDLSDGRTRVRDRDRFCPYKSVVVRKGPYCVLPTAARDPCDLCEIPKKCGVAHNGAYALAIARVDRIFRGPPLPPSLLRSYGVTSRASKARRSAAARFGTAREANT